MRKRFKYFGQIAQQPRILTVLTGTDRHGYPIAIKGIDH